MKYVVFVTGQYVLDDANWDRKMESVDDARAEFLIMYEDGDIKSDVPLRIIAAVPADEVA